VVNPELWILETAVHIQMPFWALVHPHMESLHNKPSHGLDRSALAKLLEGLCWRGDIFIEDEADHRRLYSGEELNVLLQSPRRCPGNEYVYGLTEKGGMRWERESQADWNRYVSEGWVTDSCEFVCADPDRLTRYLSSGPVGAGYVIMPGTEERDVLKPWAVSYWKTLPAGYRLRCRTTPAEWSLANARASMAEDSWYRASYETERS
jgi:hypothetical protein